MPYARVSGIATDCCGRAAGDVTSTLIQLFERLRKKIPKGALPILSGASGVEPTTGEEIDFLDYLPAYGVEPIVRAYGSLLGHSVEAHFPAGVALAALAARHGAFPSALDCSGIERPFAGSVDRVLVTGAGHWRGAALALVEAIA
jgi:3-oxoacyl-[acyl-carrier-protein] synthase II